MNTEVIVELEVVLFKCEDCGMEYMPEHPDYPKKFEYSKRLIQTALSMHFRKNLSGNKIADFLAEYCRVLIPPKTIYSWINNLTENFMKSEFKTEPERALDAYKALTIDGTHFNLGKKLLGKKKMCNYRQ